MESLKSPRMEKVLHFLLARGEQGATGLEIDRACGHIVGVRDYIRRLRDKGYKIDTIEMPRTETGARVVKYKLWARPSCADVEDRPSANTDGRGLSPLPTSAQGELFG